MTGCHRNIQDNILGREAGPDSEPKQLQFTLNPSDSQAHFHLGCFAAACITLVHDECVLVTNPALMQTVLSAGKKRGLSCQNTKQAKQHKQTRNGCHTVSLYGVRVPENRLEPKEALQRTGDILKGAQSHLSFQLLLRNVCF